MIDLRQPKEDIIKEVLFYWSDCEQNALFVKDLNIKKRTCVVCWEWRSFIFDNPINETQINL